MHMCTVCVYVHVYVSCVHVCVYSIVCIYVYACICKLMSYVLFASVHCVLCMVCLLSVSLPPSLSLCMCDVMKKHASTPFVCSVVASKEGHRFGCDKLAK